MTAKYLLYGTPVLPTTDSGWATYLAGSREFLPAVTNLFADPRLSSNPFTVADNGCSSASTMALASNGDGSNYLEWNYTVHADDTVAAVPKIVISHPPLFAAGAGTYSFEYQLAVSNARSLDYVYSDYCDAGYSQIARVVVNPITGWIRASKSYTWAASSNYGPWFFNMHLLATLVAGDTITFRVRRIDVCQESILTPYFDGSYPNCVLNGDGTSTRTASDLILPGYVEITAAGAVAAGTKVVYAQIPATGYYGPAVVTDAAKSEDWQAAFYAATDLDTIWVSLVTTDMLLPLASDGVGYTGANPNVNFGGVDLSPYLVTPGVGGVHDLAGQEIVQLFLPGQEMPVETVKRLTARPLTFTVVVAGSDHAAMLTNLQTLKGLVSPSLGYQALTVVDRPGLQVMARCKGFPIDLSSIPYLMRVVTFPLVFDRWPYWEDAGLVTADPTGSSITNNGDVPCYPLWTCTVTGTLATGLWFQVGAQRYTTTAALVSTDIVTVKADSQAPTPSKNGAVDWAHTTTDSTFPSLAVGANAITKSSSNFTLKAEYRRRYA